VATERENVCIISSASGAGMEPPALEDRRRTCSPIRPECVACAAECPCRPLLPLPRDSTGQSAPCNYSTRSGPTGLCWARSRSCRPSGGPAARWSIWGRSVPPITIVSTSEGSSSDHSGLPRFSSLWDHLCLSVCHSSTCSPDCHSCSGNQDHSLTGDTLRSASYSSL